MGGQAARIKSHNVHFPDIDDDCYAIRQQNSPVAIG
jgi:hypothetical protein